MKRYLIISILLHLSFLNWMFSPFDSSEENKVMTSIEKKSSSVEVSLQTRKMDTEPTIKTMTRPSQVVQNFNTLKIKDSMVIPDKNIVAKKPDSKTMFQQEKVKLGRKPQEKSKPEQLVTQLEKSLPMHNISPGMQSASTSNNKEAHTKGINQIAKTLKQSKNHGKSLLPSDKEVLSMKPNFREPPRSPSYPETARRRKQEGEVIVEVRLDKSGQQMSLKVKRSSGFDILDQAALKAVTQWSFKPEYLNGIAVASRVQIPIHFNLMASQ